LGDDLVAVVVEPACGGDDRDLPLSLLLDFGKELLVCGRDTGMTQDENVHINTTSYLNELFSPKG
jgi:hypothetical protein